MTCLMHSFISIMYTHAADSQALPSPSQRWELQGKALTSSEICTPYSVTIHMYTVEQSIGMNIINRSFTRYTELAGYPDKGSNR